MAPGKIPVSDPYLANFLLCPDSISVSGYEEAAGVALEGESQEFITRRRESTQAKDPGPGFEIQHRHDQKSKTRVPVAPYKKTHVLYFFFFLVIL